MTVLRRLSGCPLGAKPAFAPKGHPLSLRKFYTIKL